MKKRNCSRAGKKIFNGNWYKFQGSVDLKSRQDNYIITRSNIIVRVIQRKSLFRSRYGSGIRGKAPNGKPKNPIPDSKFHWIVITVDRAIHRVTW